MQYEKIIQALKTQGIENPSQKDVEDFKVHLKELATTQTIEWANLINTIGTGEWVGGKYHVLSVDEILKGEGGRAIYGVFLSKLENLFL